MQCAIVGSIGMLIFYYYADRSGKGRGDAIHGMRRPTKPKFVVERFFDLFVGSLGF